MTTDDQKETQGPPDQTTTQAPTHGEDAKACESKDEAAPISSKSCEEGKRGPKPKEDNTAMKPPPSRGPRTGKNRRINQMRRENAADGAGAAPNGASNQGGGEGGGGGGGGGAAPRRRQRLDTWNARDLKIVRALSGILRHGMMGFVTDDQGYLFLEDILEHHHFKDQLLIKFDDLKRICNDKKGNKQFELDIEETEGKQLYKVRMRPRQDPKTDEEITLKKAEEYTVCIHGTYWKAWEDMKQKGISRFYPNHIHFASGMLASGEEGIVSGKMSKNCEVLVYIDLKRAVAEGIKFYRSDDGVLWTDGNSQGVLPPKYFNCAIHVSPVTGQQIYAEDLSELHGEGEAMESANGRKKQGGGGDRGGGGGGGGRPSSAMSRGGRGGGRGRGGRGGRGGGGGRGGARGGGNQERQARGESNTEQQLEEEGFKKVARDRRNRNRNRNRDRQQQQQNQQENGGKAGGDSKGSKGNEPSGKPPPKAAPTPSGAAGVGGVVDEVAKVKLSE